MSGPFPETPAFDEVLSTLTLNAPDKLEGWASSLIAFPPSRHPDGSCESGHEIALWFRTTHSVTWSSIRKKLSSILTAKAHAASDDVCDSIMGLFALASSSRKFGSTELLNDILSMIVPCDLSQYFAFLVRDKLTINYEVAGFRVGPLDLNQLAYRSKKAGSDYAKEHVKQLSDLPLSISRLTKVHVIPWETYLKTYFEQVPSSERDIRYMMVDRYAHAVAEALFEDFFRDFREAQLMPQALGASWLSVDFLLRLAGSERVSIFLNVQGQRFGWVAPTTMTIKVDLGGPHVGVPLVLNSLTNHFGALADGPVDQVIRTYCRFLAEAAAAAPDSRNSDAFLYHVIALDLLLGEKGSSTASVTKRSALLAHRGLNVTYDELLKKCDRVYDARSQYVHAGKAPDTELLAVVEEITREIVFSLFRLKAAGANADSTFRDTWVRRVDVLIAKLAAKEPISEEEFRRVGVACGDDFSYLELRDGLASGTTREKPKDET
ncbi:MAG: hypothetical protein HONBIEJF_00328 [Fimbriimonadaceae bacterium]|nr:hypothetical protein [Fimbriimonadaceae bacterium]